MILAITNTKQAKEVLNGHKGDLRRYQVTWKENGYAIYLYLPLEKFSYFSNFFLKMHNIVWNEIG